MGKELVQVFQVFVSLPNSGGNDSCSAVPTVYLSREMVSYNGWKCRAGTLFCPSHTLSHVPYLPASVIHFRISTLFQMAFQQHFGHCGFRHTQIWTGITVAIIFG